MTQQTRRKKPGAIEPQAMFEVLAPFSQQHPIGAAMVNEFVNQWCDAGYSLDAAQMRLVTGLAERVETHIRQFLAEQH